MQHDPGNINGEPARTIDYAPPALRKKSPWRIVGAVALFVVLAVVAVIVVGCVVFVASNLNSR